MKTKTQHWKFKIFFHNRVTSSGAKKTVKRNSFVHYVLMQCPKGMQVNRRAVITITDSKWKRFDPNIYKLSRCTKTASLRPLAGYEGSCGARNQ